MKRFIQLSALTLVLASLGGTAFASMMNTTSPSSDMSQSLVSAKATEISHDQARQYQKIGNVTVSQDGFTMGNDPLAKKVSERGGSYFVIIGEQGHQDHKTVEADIYR